MRNKGDYYSYVACYWDDPIIVHKDPDHLFDSTRGKGLTIKEKSDKDYFLGRYLERVKEPNTNNNILTWVYKTYVKHMMDNLKNTLGSSLPSNILWCPLNKSLS